MHYTEFLSLEIKQLSQLLITTSGIFLAVERHKEKQAEIEKWLLQELSLCLEKKNFDFHNIIRLNKATNHTYYCYNYVTKTKSLIETNPYLKDEATREKLVTTHSVITSCGVEGVKVSFNQVIEIKLPQQFVHKPQPSSSRSTYIGAIPF